jgi:hypothetical protein
MTSPASPLARYRQLRDQIAGQLWQVWWPHAEAGTEACVAHLGEAATEAILDRLTLLPRRAEKAIDHLGIVATTESIPNGLL